MSHVLVVNSGSSSIKYRLLDMAAQRPIAWGIADRIGEDGGELTHRRPGPTPTSGRAPSPTTRPG